MPSPYNFPSAASGLQVATETFAGLANGGGTLNSTVATAHSPKVLLAWYLYHSNGADIIIDGGDYPLAGSQGRVMTQVPAANQAYVASQSAASIAITGANAVTVNSLNGLAVGTWTLVLVYGY